MRTRVLSAMLGVALGWQPSVPSLQGTPAPAQTATRERVEVGVELSGPRQSTCVWAASEWTLSFDNRGVDDLPFSDSLLEPGGYGGARVTFEIETGGKVVREFASKNSCTVSRCGPPDKTKVVKPGDSAEIPVVLHGEMDIDLAAHARDGEVDRRFVPAFETAGSYSVTALLHWGGITVRSNPVTIEVAEAPAGTERALEGLEDLARAGICIDVQGMYYNSPWTVLERISDFVEREKHTLYGTQIQLGLAQALLTIVRSLGDGITAGPLPTGIHATLERVRSLVPRDLPLHFGLERSLSRLKADLAAEERKAR